MLVLCNQLIIFFLQVSCSVVNKCLAYNPCLSRNYYQRSHTVKLQRSQAGQIILPRKLRKSTLWQTNFTQRQIATHCSSDLSTSCREELPSYLTVNVLKDQSCARQGIFRKVIVILNPNSGFRSSREVFYQKVQPTLEVNVPVFHFQKVLSVELARKGFYFKCNLKILISLKSSGKH